MPHNRETSDAKGQMQKGPSLFSRGNILIHATLFGLVSFLFVVSTWTVRLCLICLGAAVALCAAIKERRMRFLFFWLLIPLLYICCVPGIARLFFDYSESVRFRICRSIYEQYVLSLLDDVTIPDRQREFQPVEELYFVSERVLIRKEEGHMLILFMTEPVRCSGYAWASDEAAGRWMYSCHRLNPIDGCWYFYQMYPGFSMGDGPAKNDFKGLDRQAR